MGEADMHLATLLKPFIQLMLNLKLVSKWSLGMRLALTDFLDSNLSLKKINLKYP